jgi:hypothetical protein
VTVREIFLCDAMAVGFKQVAQLRLHLDRSIIATRHDCDGLGEMPLPIGAFPPRAVIRLPRVLRD